MAGHKYYFKDLNLERVCNVNVLSSEHNLQVGHRDSLWTHLWRQPLDLDTQKW